LHRDLKHKNSKISLVGRLGRGGGRGGVVDGGRVEDKRGLWYRRWGKGGVGEVCTVGERGAREWEEGGVVRERGGVRLSGVERTTGGAQL